MLLYQYHIKDSVILKTWTIAVCYLISTSCLHVITYFLFLSVGLLTVGHKPSDKPLRMLSSVLYGKPWTQKAHRHFKARGETMIVLRSARNLIRFTKQIFEIMKEKSGHRREFGLHCAAQVGPSSKSVVRRWVGGLGIGHGPVKVLRTSGSTSTVSLGLLFLLGEHLRGFMEFTKDVGSRRPSRACNAKCASYMETWQAT